MADLERLLAEGEAVINGGLESRANELDMLIKSHFPDKSLQAIAQEFEAAMHDTSLNQKVAQLAVIVREQACVSVEDFKRCEMWLALKAPTVMDGNNFGVDVQNFVAAELKNMRHAMQAMLDGASNYHWQRGNGLEKFAMSKSVEEEKTESTEEGDGKEGKTNSKKQATSTKTTEKTPPPIADFKRYTVALDVKQYHTAYTQLLDQRNCYVKARVLFQKNMKRLADPRGEGENGDRGVMSMF